ncbi:MAG: hypothetical protein ACRCSQ_02555, partial [Bacteroidales bacterium]
MIEMTAAEYFDELRILSDTTELTLLAKYRRVRFLFERLCKQVTADHQTQFPNFFSRLSWICQHLLGKEKELVRDLTSLRVRLNKIVREEQIPHEGDIRQDILIIADAVRRLLIAAYPDFFLQLEKSTRRKQYADQQNIETQTRMRARFVRRDGDTGVIVVPEEQEHGQEVKVRLNREHSGAFLFSETLESMHAGAQVNLLNVRDYHKDCSLTADIIVLEPDFLLDISAIAECFRDYGNHPLNYFMGRLLPDQNTHPMLLGNIANQFLDDIINETDEHPADYMVSMSKAFRLSPISIAACEVLNDSQKEKEFFAETKSQFRNIRDIVKSHFPEVGIDRSKALLEPSFVCES